MFSETERGKILRFEVICFIPGNFEAVSPLNLNCCYHGRSTFVGNNALLPSDIRAILPAQRFWWVTGLWLGVM